MECGKDSINRKKKEGKEDRSEGGGKKEYRKRSKGVD